MKGLTSRQQQLLAFIQRVIAETGMPPTRAELCQQFGFRSPTAADDHLKALARKRMIELLPGVSRGIRLLQTSSPKSASSGLPLVGRVAAGEPVLAAAHIEDYVDSVATQFKPRADYLLRVVGESMREAGILNQDLLAVHRSKVAENGQIVVARIEDEVTVKRFYRQGQHVALRAENPDFMPIHVDLATQNFVIEGLGVGVLRQFDTR